MHMHGFAPVLSATSSQVCIWITRQLPALGLRGAVAARAAIGRGRRLAILLAATASACLRRRARAASASSSRAAARTRSRRGRPSCASFLLVVGLVACVRFARTCRTSGGGRCGPRRTVIVFCILSDDDRSRRRILRACALHGQLVPSPGLPDGPRRSRMPLRALAQDRSGCARCRGGILRTYAAVGLVLVRGRWNRGVEELLGAVCSTSCARSMSPVSRDGARASQRLPSAARSA